MARGALFLTLVVAATGKVYLRDPYKKEVASQGNTVWSQHFGSLLVFDTHYGVGDQYAVEIQLVEVHEVSLGGGQLNHEAYVSSNPHSFAFSEAEDRFTMPSVGDNLVVQNLTAEGLSLNTVVGMGHEFDLQAYIFTEAGEVESRPVNRGDVYLRANVNQWSFCGSCTFDICDCKFSDAEQRETGYIGAYIDFKFLITGYDPNRTLQNGEFRLGGGVSMQPLTGVTVDDGAEVQQPPGYPRLDVEDQRRVLTMRFPKFQHTASVDAVLRLNWDDADPPWSAEDLWLLFWLPSLVMVGILGVLYWCRPKAVKPGHMQKSLRDARRRKRKEEEAQKKKLEEEKKAQEQELQGTKNLLPGVQPHAPPRNLSAPHLQPDGMPRATSQPQHPHASVSTETLPRGGSKLLAPQSKRPVLDV